jgi:epoxyqueuosine reductase
LPQLTPDYVKKVALDCGFDLAGIASAAPAVDYDRYADWVAAGHAGEMSYLTDHRGELRNDPRELLPEVRSILCVGKIYNIPQPQSRHFTKRTTGWISRYAWGEDYHVVLKQGLERIAARLKQESEIGFVCRGCVDTAPLLERSYARLAGLGWIGRNTCLINQQVGSWLFLGELLLSIDLQPDTPPPDRCGTCRRCIDACPTEAIVPSGDGWTLDSRRCISYLTIEKRGDFPSEHAEAAGNHIFGCDICQEVCPWNRREVFSEDPAWQPKAMAPPLDELASVTEEQFRTLFRKTPVWRTKYRGFLRNVANALGNTGDAASLEPLRKLSESPDTLVASTARQAEARLRRSLEEKGCPVLAVNPG